MKDIERLLQEQQPTSSSTPDSLIRSSLFSTIHLVQRKESHMPLEAGNIKTGHNSVRTPTNSQLRRVIRIAMPMLAGVLIVCSTVSISHALSGYLASGHATTTDVVGVPMGSTSTFTCFLSGVSGNLNVGTQPGFGCGTKGLESIAEVTEKHPSTGQYWLIAHGGACISNVNLQVWDNNPVQAMGTCFPTADNVKESYWQHGAPVKVAGLNAPNNKVRRCFLSGIWGIAGAWNSSNRFAKVRKVTATDSSHSTTGWYIEANLPMSSDDSHPRVAARCVDFPQGTDITVDTTPLQSTTKTYTIASEGGVKACALMGIKGAFNVNSYSDGVVMNFPSSATGNWTLTVTGGKTATWACAK
jgi:hypothetical protein